MNQKFLQKLTNISKVTGLGASIYLEALFYYINYESDCVSLSPTELVGVVASGVSGVVG